MHAPHPTLVFRGKKNRSLNEDDTYHQDPRRNHSPPVPKFNGSGGDAWIGHKPSEIKGGHGQKCAGDHEESPANEGKSFDRYLDLQTKVTTEANLSPHHLHISLQINLTTSIKKEKTPDCSGVLPRSLSGPCGRSRPNDATSAPWPS